MSELLTPLERYKLIDPLLGLLYPNPPYGLNFKTPFELLVGTILAAQCTDERVNAVTPALFARFPDAFVMATGNLAEIEELVHATGFYRNKAKSILAASKMLVSDFNGVVPDNLQDLTKLPGIARKSANVILGNGFGKNEGVVVDTHVQRLSGRLALSSQTDPLRIEQDLMTIVPQPEWTRLANRLIWHGRNTCEAKKPKCSSCTIAQYCPAFAG